MRRLIFMSSFMMRVDNIKKFTFWILLFDLWSVKRLCKSKKISFDEIEMQKVEWLLDPKITIKIQKNTTNNSLAARDNPPIQTRIRRRIYLTSNKTQNTTQNSPSFPKWISRLKIVTPPSPFFLFLSLSNPSHSLTKILYCHRQLHRDHVPPPPPLFCSNHQGLLSLSLSLSK